MKFPSTSLSSIVTSPSLLSLIALILIPSGQSFGPTVITTTTNNIHLATKSPLRHLNMIASIPRNTKHKSKSMNNNNYDNQNEYYYSSSSNIDHELSSSSSSSSCVPNPMIPSSSTSSSILSEMHSILDDGLGHINKELATSIWTWENENLQQKSLDLDNDNTPSFPLASKLKYSTRDGLRLIESIAREMEQVDSVCEGGGGGGGDATTNGGIVVMERYNDLVQEGVVALMKCMVIWENNQEDSSSRDTKKNKSSKSSKVKIQPGEGFDSFASREIRKSMSKYLIQTSDGVGVMKMNLDLLRKGVEELEKGEGGGGRGAMKKNSKKKEIMQATMDVKVSSSEPLDQIVKSLTLAVLEENPTPDEIALSEMIRNDIVDFLQRTLDTVELTVIRMRFGLEEVGTSLEDIALNLDKTVDDVKDIERNALSKLRTSFSNDYIGAYLDDDNTEEVSL